MLAGFRQLFDAVAAAQQKIVIVAPYIKRDALGELLGEQSGKTSVVIISRFAPADVAAGTTDADIHEVVKRFDCLQLRRCPNLHAKYYRADNCAFAGSANVSRSGLGLSSMPNLEFLCCISEDSADAFEKLLWQSSTAITPATLATIEALARRRQEALKYSGGERWDDWVPSCVQPDVLFQIYSSGMADAVTTTFQAGRADLDALAISPGLKNESDFKHQVGEVLLCFPFFAALPGRMNPTKNGIKTISDSAAIAMLRNWPNMGGDDNELRERWATIKKWISCFLSHEYTTHVLEEELILGRRFSE